MLSVSATGVGARQSVRCGLAWFGGVWASRAPAQDDDACGSTARGSSVIRGRLTSQKRAVAILEPHGVSLEGVSVWLQTYGERALLSLDLDCVAVMCPVACRRPFPPPTRPLSAGEVDEAEQERSRLAQEEFDTKANWFSNPLSGFTTPTAHKSGPGKYIKTDSGSVLDNPPKRRKAAPVEEDPTPAPAPAPAPKKPMGKFDFSSW